MMSICPMTYIVGIIGTIYYYAYLLVAASYPIPSSIFSEKSSKIMKGMNTNVRIILPLFKYYPHSLMSLSPYACATSVSIAPFIPYSIDRHMMLRVTEPRPTPATMLASPK